MTHKSNGRLQRDAGRDAETVAQRRADFHAGIDAAKDAIGPLLMRRFFVRGLAVGALLGAAAASALGWWL